MGNPVQSYEASPAIRDHTQVNALLDLPTPDGWKAELTVVLVIYQDGLPVRRQSPIQVGTNHLIATRPGVAPTTSRSRVQRTNRYLTKPPSLGKLNTINILPLTTWALWCMHLHVLRFVLASVTRR